jgi:hypothetical protein
LKIILDFMASGGGQDELVGDLSEFAEDHGINMGGLKTVVRGVLVFFTGAVKTNLSPVHVRDDMLEFGAFWGGGCVGVRFHRTRLLLDRCVPTSTYLA